MNIILRNSVPQSVDEDNHTVRIRFTDESVDSYGTSLKFDGWDFKRYMDNPTVQLDHYSDAASNIGRVLEIIPVSMAVTGRGVRCRVDSYAPGVSGLKTW